MGPGRKKTNDKSMNRLKRFFKLRTVAERKERISVKKW